MVKNVVDNTVIFGILSCNQCIFTLNLRMMVGLRDFCVLRERKLTI